MRRITKQAIIFFVLVAAIVLSFAGTAPYLIEVPANWNGTLFLYSHGYVIPGGANPAKDVGDRFTRFFMLSSGYVLAGSSFATTGWQDVDATDLNNAAAGTRIQHFRHATRRRSRSASVYQI
jgi:hypothetical protein